ncbi:hypothetical protein SESBI_48274 [Sesbania bispinosa]|nr:hypothetical protein SESBI_48274 [Sesbania bispinosa]
MAKANPPTLRPWSFLASLRSVPPPPSAQPTFSLRRTASTQSSKPSEPTPGAATRVSAPSSTKAQNVAPSFRASQARNAFSLNNNANATKSLPTTTPTIQNQRHQNTFKLNVNPEIEPKTRVEEEPKTVLVNRIMEKPGTVNGKGNDSFQKGLNELKLSDFEDSGTRVITISGENKGANMEIIQSRKKPNYVHKMDNAKINESENGNEKVRRRPMRGVYMNSNVQCVNNSLMFDSCCSHHDPGVRANHSLN